LEQAEPLFREALALRKEALEEDDPAVAASLNNLARLLKTQGKDLEAETLYREALAIMKKTLGENHPDFAQSLNNLAAVLKDEGKYIEAESLYREAFGIFKKVHGEDHPTVATNLNNLAQVLRVQENIPKLCLIFLRHSQVKRGLLKMIILIYQQFWAI
jgi:tetratricopeptide (TPR) repeat protein